MRKIPTNTLKEDEHHLSWCNIHARHTLCVTLVAELSFVTQRFSQVSNCTLFYALHRCCRPLSNMLILTNYKANNEFWVLKMIKVHSTSHIQLLAFSSFIMWFKKRSLHSIAAIFSSCYKFDYILHITNHVPSSFFPCSPNHLACTLCQHCQLIIIVLCLDTSFWLVSSIDGVIYPA